MIRVNTYIRCLKQVTEFFVKMYFRLFLCYYQSLFTRVFDTVQFVTFMSDTRTPIDGGDYTEKEVKEVVYTPP